MQIPQIGEAAHQRKVQQLLAAFREADQGTVAFKKQSASHMVPHKRRSQEAATISTDLTDIVTIDPKAKTATVEANVPFAKLARATLVYGLCPMVVPELEGITVGGAISGCSIESMSYRYGGFHDTCLEYEIITGEGKLMTCSPSKNSDIFHMVHGSFGTIGRLTKLTCKLVEAKPYVEMNYETYPDSDSFTNALKKNVGAKSYDFIDGIIHDSQTFVLCLGRFIDSAPYTSDYTKNNIFYKSTRSRKQDYLTTYDYFFRYDRECHWISRSFGLENPVLRRLLGRWFLGSTNILGMAKRLSPVLNRMRPVVTVDLFVAFSKFTKFFAHYQEKINYYPIWIVPYRMGHPYPWINPDYIKDIDDTLFIDFAIYGLRQKKGHDYYADIDELLWEVRGIKTLISLNRYTKKRFWQIFNKPSYDKVKAKTDPNNRLQDLYEKTHR